MRYFKTPHEEITSLSCTMERRVSKDFPAITEGVLILCQHKSTPTFGLLKKSMGTFCSWLTRSCPSNTCKSKIHLSLLAQNRVQGRPKSTLKSDFKKPLCVLLRNLSVHWQVFCTLLFGCTLPVGPYLPKDDMLAVQPRGVCKGNEELAPALAKL